MPPRTKVCGTCGKRKGASQFPRQPNAKDGSGLRAHCRLCHGARIREAKAEKAETSAVPDHEVNALIEAQMHHAPSEPFGVLSNLLSDMQAVGARSVTVELDDGTITLKPRSHDQ